MLPFPSHLYKPSCFVEKYLGGKETGLHFSQTGKRRGYHECIFRTFKKKILEYSCFTILYSFCSTAKSISYSIHIFPLLGFHSHLDHHRALGRILLKKQTQNKYFLGSNQVSDTGCMISEKTEGPCPHVIHPLVVEMAHNLIITQINR